MSTKQIFALASVAVIALAAAILFRSHAPSPVVDLSHENTIATTSAITAINPGNSSTAPSPTVYEGSPHTEANKRTASTTVTRDVQSVVHMKIVEPDGTSAFDVDLREGEDLCENIQEAKSEGHIRSFTIDDSYLDTFGSRYVREINGYSNNWTVEVNGVGPKGCSLYNPRAGDRIVWEFGASAH